MQATQILTRHQSISALKKTQIINTDPICQTTGGKEKQVANAPPARPSYLEFARSVERLVVEHGGRPQVIHAVLWLEVGHFSFEDGARRRRPGHRPNRRVPPHQLQLDGRGRVRSNS